MSLIAGAVPASEMCTGGRAAHAERGRSGTPCFNRRMNVLAVSTGAWITIILTLLIILFFALRDRRRR